MPRGKWRERSGYALAPSLQGLGPHRVTLRALAPIMVGDADEGALQRTRRARETESRTFSNRRSWARPTHRSDHLPTCSAICFTWLTLGQFCGGCSIAAQA